MFLLIFTILAIAWLVLSLVAYFYIRSVFKKYKDFPRPQVSKNHQPAVRKDFGKWDESAILKGCLLRFPLHMATMSWFLAGFGLFATLQRLLKYPGWVTNLHRYYFGRLAMYTCFNLVQQFDARQKIDTPIVISNHVSWVDIIYMGGCFRPLSFVSKKEVQSLPVFNAIAKHLRVLYVDRSSPEARHKIKEEIMERAQQYQRNPLQTYPVIIYPQGTVTNGRSIISFKNGAFQPLSPITIFSLKYQCKQFHLGLNQVSTLDYSFIIMCLRPTLRVRHSTIAPLENETVEQYRQRCRQKLRDQSGFGLYDCDYKDILEYDKRLREAVNQRKSKSQ